MTNLTAKESILAAFAASSPAEARDILEACLAIETDPTVRALLIATGRLICNPAARDQFVSKLYGELRASA